MNSLMKKIFLFVFSLFLFSSCSVSSNLFKGSLFDGDVSQIQAPQITISKSKITMQLSSGVSLVTFPLLAEIDAENIQKNPNVVRIWQENDVSTLEKNQSYFIEVKDATDFSWTPGDEVAYNSTFLQAGNNFPAILKGSDPLLLSEIKINGQNLLDAFASDYPPVTHFYIFGSDKVLHDLVKESVKDMPLLLGGGVMIESPAFGKLSWPLSALQQKQVDTENTKVQKQEDQIKNKETKEQQKYEKQVEKTFEKMNAELSKKIFEETKNLPQMLLKVLKSKNESQITKLFANRQLLSQVHAFADIQAASDAVNPVYWQEKEALFRPFSVLSAKGFDTVNTMNRSVVFLEFPYDETELKEKGGAIAFYEGLAFIRAKDCSWQFDPLETSKIEKVLLEKDDLYDSKHLKKILDAHEIALAEPEDFSLARNACKPEIKGIIDSQKGKLISLSDEKSSDSKLLKNHEESCGKFSAALQKLFPETVQEVVLNSEDEPKIEPGNFPNISFSEDICVSVWPQILERSDLLDVLNEKDGADETLQSMIIDDALIAFLGGNAAFSCNKLEDSAKQNTCYFGNAIIKSSASSCKKITSKALQLSCAGAVAMAKKDPKQCDKVLGAYDPAKDKENIEKQVFIRNCQLDAVIASAKDTKECKQFKRRFLFFFHLSTPTSKMCESYVSGEKKVTPWTSKLDEDAMKESMGIAVVTN